ncbi:MAG: hypothetical protein KYX62_18815 [Pseudomonadota bacterium]|nr:hypothetical protein [Pseudomonadota bacterium]
MNMITKILPLSAAVLLTLGAAASRADDQTDVTMTVIDENAEPQAVYHQIELPLQQQEQVRLQAQTQTQAQVRTQTRTAYDDEASDKAEAVRERVQETVRERVQERVQAANMDEIRATAMENITAQQGQLAGNQ